MRNLLFHPVIFLILCSFYSLESNAQWVYNGSPQTGHPLNYDFNGNDLIMASDAGLFQSSDMGHSWNSIPLPDTISSANEAYESNGRLFLFNRGDFVEFFRHEAAYRSDDHGLHWKSIYPFTPEDHGYLAPLFHGDTLILWKGNQLALSFDGGDSYEYHSTSIKNAEKIFFHQNQLMASNFRGLYTSYDWGNTWDTLYTVPDSLYNFAIASINNRLFKFEKYFSFPIDSGYFSMSVDNGLTWNQLSGFEDYSGSYSFIFGDQNYLFIADNFSNNTIYRSSDAGVTWIKLNTPEVFYNIKYDNGLLLGLTTFDYVDHVWISYNQGDSFQKYDSGFYGADCENFTSVEDQIWVRANGGIYKKENENTWTEVINGKFIAAADNQNLIANLDGVLKKSNNGGQSWQKIPASAFGETHYPNFYNVNASRGWMYAYVDFDSWVSTDFGNNWIPIDSLKNNAITNVAFDPPYHYVASSNGEMFRSIDGIHWEDLTFDLFAPGSYSFELLTVFNGYSYISTDYGDFRLKLGDTTWQTYHITDPNPILFAPEVHLNSLISFNNALIGTSFGHGVFTSVNNGETWEPFNDGLSDYQTEDVHIFNDKLYLAVHGGVWLRSLSDLSIVRTVEPQNNLTLFVAPNPMKDFLEVRLPNYSIPIKVHFSLYAAEGNLLQAYTKDASEIMHLDVNALPAGLYFLQASSGNDHSITKLIKL